MLLLLNLPVLACIFTFHSQIHLYLFEIVILQLAIVSFWGIYTSTIPSTIGEIRLSYDRKSEDNSHSLVSINLATKLAFLTVSIGGIAYLGISGSAPNSLLKSYAVINFSLSFICFLISSDIYDSSKNTPYMQHSDRCLMLTKRGARIYQHGLTYLALAICSSAILLNGIIGISVTILMSFMYIYYNRPTIILTGSNSKYLLSLVVAILICVLPYFISYCIFYPINWSISYLLLLLYILVYLAFGVVLMMKFRINVAQKKHPINKFIIAVEGLDGVGKTTICKELSNLFSAQIIKFPNKIFSNLREEVDKLNNSNLRFSLYKTMMLFFYSEMLSANTNVIILDRYWVSGLVLFELLYADKNVDLETYVLKLNDIVVEFQKPDIVVYVNCRDDILQARINSRIQKADTDNYCLSQTFRERANQSFEKYKSQTWININNTENIDKTIKELLTAIIKKMGIGLNK